MVDMEVNEIVFSNSIPKELHHRMKVYAVANSMSMKEFLISAIELKLNGEGKEGIKKGLLRKRRDV